MRRIKRVILVAIAVAALAVGAAAPALADDGGTPHRASCGYGKTGAALGKQNPVQPGNGEASKDPPIGCKGRG